MDLLPLTDISQLEEIDFQSAVRKQVIFKHSTRCFVSMIVLKKVKTQLKEATENSIFDIYYLDLIKYRSLSNSIADRYNIIHESPQIIVIQNGSSVFDASHSDVSLKDAGLI